MTLETPVLQEVRAALAASGRLLFWRCNSGVDIIEGKDGKPRRAIRYGLGLGAPDLVGALRPHGRWCGFEVKTPEGKLSKNQRSWHGALREAGGFVATVRSGAEALAALARAEAGASQ